MNKDDSGERNRRKFLRIKIDWVQLMLSKGLVVHPHTYDAFIDQLIELENKGKFCFTPITILNDEIGF